MTYVSRFCIAGNTVILPSSIDTIGESESPEYNREHVGSVFSDDCNETRITAALDEHFILQSQSKIYL